MEYKVIDNMSGEVAREYDDVSFAVEFARAMGPGPFGVRAYVIDSKKKTVWPAARWGGCLKGESQKECNARLREWFKGL